LRGQFNDSRWKSRRDQEDDMTSTKIRLTVAALAAVGTFASTGVAVARAPVHRLGGVATAAHGRTHAAAVKGGSTGDPGSATDAQCQKIAEGINSWQNAAVQSWESSNYNVTDEVSHDLKNGKDLESDGMDQGCFFYNE
jgi:hypothetical protein